MTKSKLRNKMKTEVFLFLNPPFIDHPPFLPPTFSSNPHRKHTSYLVGALAHSVYQLLDDHVHTLDAGPLQLYDLLLYNGLKRHVWGEKSSPETHQEKKKRKQL